LLRGEFVICGDGLVGLAGGIKCMGVVFKKVRLIGPQSVGLAEVGRSLGGSILRQKVRT